ncbi:MAG: hypothetical protein ACOH1Y_15860 [Propionicimonas sp.]
MTHDGPRHLASRPQPLRPAFSPPAYPEPDYAREALVTHVYVAPNPQDGDVGWLILQGDALAWFTTGDHWADGAVMGQHVTMLMREGALAGIPAQAGWDQVLATTLHTPPLTRPLEDVLAEVRAAWG